jgi:hypothetical protein
MPSIHCEVLSTHGTPPVVYFCVVCLLIRGMQSIICIPLCGQLEVVYSQLLCAPFFFLAGCINGQLWDAGLSILCSLHQL